MLRIDPAAELAAVKEFVALTRRRRYRPRRLDLYRAELVALRRAGASLREIVVWLRRMRRCDVHKSTLCRYLRSLPELGGEQL